jgi:hypothetical protein
VGRLDAVADRPARRPARPARRSPGECRLPAARLPLHEREPAGTTSELDQLQHHGRPGTRPVAPDGRAVVHHQADVHAPAGRAADRRRPDRRSAGWPQAGRPRGRVRAARAVPGDLRTSRRALRRPRLLPKQQQDPDQARRGGGRGGDRPGGTGPVSGPADRPQARGPGRRPAVHPRGAAGAYRRADQGRTGQELPGLCHACSQR